MLAVRLFFCSQSTPKRRITEGRKEGMEGGKEDEGRKEE
jgi:hypothetical protein